MKIVTRSGGSSGPPIVASPEDVHEENQAGMPPTCTEVVNTEVSVVSERVVRLIADSRIRVQVPITDTPVTSLQCSPPGQVTSHIPSVPLVNVPVSISPVNP
ncbi:hypothetical protein V6N13_005131 [Hibiscus sabdariffa]